MPDDLLLPALLAAFTAVVSGIVTFFLTRMRERQKDLYERRTKALSEMQRRAYSVVVATERQSNALARVVRSVPKENIEDGGYAVSQVIEDPRIVKELFDPWTQPVMECESLLKLIKNTDEEMSSFRDSYQRCRPFLDTKTRTVLESFNRAYERHLRPQERVMDLDLQQAQESIRTLLGGVEGMQKGLGGSGFFGWLSRWRNEEWIKQTIENLHADIWRFWNDEVTPWTTHRAEEIQSADLPSYLARLDAEADRVANAHPQWSGGRARR
jgi:hypothetical protein